MNKTLTWILLGASLLQGGSCNPSQKPRESTVSTLESAKNETTCTFENKEQLRAYLDQHITPRTKKAAVAYDNMFGTNYSANGIEIQWTINNNQDYPHFYFDVEKHQLMINYAPATDSDTYVKNMCTNQIIPGWKFYKDTTLEFAEHETGHWYHDQFMRERGINTTWGNYDNPKDTQFRSAKLIHEGVACYLTTKLDPKQTQLGDPAYENKNPFVMLTKDPGMFYFWVYPAGERVVTPILDKDFQGGLADISQNPPHDLSGHGLVVYQRRAVHTIKYEGRTK